MLHVMRNRCAVVALLLLSLAANGSGSVLDKRCSGVIVRSIAVSNDTETAILAERTSAPPRVRISVTSDHHGAATIVAVGPVLGLMDSREIATDVSCSDDGVVLTATLTRSAEYTDSIKKNVLWRPRLSVRIDRKRRVVIRTVWRMRVTTGAEVTRSRMSPYPEQRYPMIVTRILRAPS